MKPNLFIVGAPKCGTTSLYHALRQNPDILMSKDKEPHFFCNDLKISKYKSIKEYERLFNFSTNKRKKIIGEASATYLFSKVAIKNIKKYNPDAKIIVCIRNPIEFVYSFHNQMIRAGQENITKFETAWDLQQERKKGHNIPRSCKIPILLQYKKWGLFSEQLARLYKNFPSAQIKLVLLDDFKENKNLINDIEKFLDVRETHNYVTPHSNKSYDVKSIFFLQILSFFSDVVTSLKNILHLNINFGIHSYLFKKNLIKKQKSIKICDKIKNEFLIEISKIEKIIKTDLSAWKI